MINWEQQLQDAVTTATTTVGAVTSTPAFAREAVSQLREAAVRFDARRDGFSQGKGDTCRDIAAKLEKFGSFASEKQKDFAMKLIGWSLPRAGGAVTFKPVGPLEVPKLFGVMQKHAHFHAEPLKLSRKNQDTLCWIIWAGQCVGKIENAVVSLFTRKLGASEPQVVALLKEFEVDPLAAAMKYGKLSGRCCSCGRDLTDPVSIEQGIGPTCAARFHG